MKVEVPPGWGDDSLSRALQAASDNASHVFCHLSNVFSIWWRVNDLYGRALAHMNRATPWFLTLFFPRTHSSWLAATRLAASGQLPEAYMVLRGCLENALYAFYIHDDPKLPGTPGRAETFLRRDEGKDWRKKVRDEFKPSLMLDLLKGKDAPIGEMARTMYDHAIDYGAHPNAGGLLTNLNFQDVKGGYQVTTEYLNADPVARGLCWKCAAIVGVCGLDIFGLMWRRRFELLGLIGDLERLRQDIERDPTVWTAGQPPGAMS